MTSVRSDRGVSLIELLVTLSISAIFASISMPSLSNFYGQLQASNDLRRLTYTLTELRGEAIRLKVNIRISFDQNGYSWDIGDNGTTDGTKDLLFKSKWEGSTPPSDIIFNGLGVVRGIGNEATIAITNRKSSLSFRINSNGYISI